jgi:outer membrane protein assembly factor BamB
MKVLTRIACGLLVVLAAGADWSQFLGPARNGVSPEKGLRTDWPREGPPALWEYAVGEGDSGPVILGDRLIVHHRVGKEDLVECLDPATGKQRWKHAYATDYEDPLGKGNGPRATPILTADRVYTLNAAGLLFCLDAADGKVVWQRDLARDYTLRDSFFGVGSSPILEDGRLLINVGAKEAGIVAFDARTGKEQWKATDQGASYASPVAATIAGERVVVFFTREGLVTLDPAKGKVRAMKRWRSRQNASVNAASPLVVDDHIFLTACYDTGAVLLKAGRDSVEEVWKSNEFLSCQFSTPVYRDGVLYGFHGRVDVEGARLRAVDWKTGKVLWEREGANSGSLIAVDGHLLVMKDDGELLLVEATPTAYREKAKASVLTRSCRAQIALADGRLFARDKKQLVCWKVAR